MPRLLSSHQRRGEAQHAGGGPVQGLPSSGSLNSLLPLTASRGQQGPEGPSRDHQGRSGPLGAVKGSSARAAGSGSSRHGCFVDTVQGREALSRVCRSGYRSGALQLRSRGSGSGRHEGRRGGQGQGARGRRGSPDVPAGAYRSPARRAVAQ